MNRYKEFQLAKIIFAFAIPAQIFFNVKFATESTQVDVISMAIPNGIFVLIYVLFYGMSTTINNDKILVRYGIGLIRKTVKLDEVRSVRVASNPWYYGWGIRVIPNGMLYNINGADGVEITFKDRFSILRIGSADGLTFAKAINELLKQ